MILFASYAVRATSYAINSTLNRDAEEAMRKSCLPSLQWASQMFYRCPWTCNTHKLWNFFPQDSRPLQTFCQILKPSRSREIATEFLRAMTDNRWFSGCVPGSPWHRAGVDSQRRGRCFYEMSNSKEQEHFLMITFRMLLLPLCFDGIVAAVRRTRFR